MTATLPQVPDTHDVLVADRVSVSFGERTVLDSVSFSVGSGEFTGLIGPNGAGKTTLLRVILGLQRPSSGRVQIAGLDQRIHRDNQPIGYVPQKVLVDPDVPIRTRDLVALGIDGHRFGLPIRSRRHAGAVDEMLHAVDAERFANARVGTLSGGELQRALIAQALVSRPRVLLLDEPLANLDPGSTYEIVALLAKVCADQGVAVLLSAHDLNPLLPVMDRVLYLAGGRAASGPADEVIRAEVLSNLYGHHVDIVRLHGRILVVTGPDAGDQPLSVESSSRAS